MANKASLLKRRASSEARRKMFGEATPAGMEDLSISGKREDIMSVPCDRLVSHPLNRMSKQNMSEEAIDELAAIITRDGQQNSPCVVRPIALDGMEKLQIVIGHRRWKALTKLGWEVKVVVREMDDKQAIRILNDDNHSAEGFTAYDIALEAREMKKTFSGVEIADILGYSPNYISNIMSIFKMPSEIREELVKTIKLQDRHIRMVRKTINEEGKDAAMKLALQISKGAPINDIDQQVNTGDATDTKQDENSGRVGGKQPGTSGFKKKNQDNKPSAGGKPDTLVNIAGYPLVLVRRAKGKIVMEIEGPDDTLAAVEDTIFKMFDTSKGLIELWVEKNKKT